MKTETERTLHIPEKKIRGIAHDMSNALMPVVGLMELLLNHPDNVKDREKLETYLGQAHTSASSAIKMIEKLRELYRIQPTA